MLLAEASGGELAFGLIFLVGTVFVVWIVTLFQGPAHYHVTYRSGVPYCGRCNRQVRLDRGYCRACNYNFVSYPGKVNLGEVRQEVFTTDTFLDKSLIESFDAFGKGFVWIGKHLASWCRATWAFTLSALSLRWITRLPEWAQPIVWGLVIPTPAIVAFILYRWLRKQ